MLIIFLVAVAVFIIAYRIYGRFLDRKFDVNGDRKTPSHTEYDGVDRVPTKPIVLLGHHFSSIAGAGPVVGPIIAGIAFGWLPALLWIVLGSIFVGGVHDYSSLMASIRHKANSVAEIAKKHMSPLSYKMFLVFIWMALVYILIVFIDLTTAGFVSSPEVASSSVFFILLALAFGITLNRLGISLWKASLVFVPLVFLGVFAGHLVPLTSDVIPSFINGDAAKTWNILLIIYCLLASVSPVWVLLQPRDYLSSFLLYGSLLGAFIGILLGGFEIKYPAFTTWSNIDKGTLFPILFITIACGACSGFHSIVASGTTSKQLDKETDARKIGYGAMLIEGLVAVIALFTVVMLAQNANVIKEHPLMVFGTGMGNFLTVFGLPFEIGRSFGILAVSTFLLTTLDTSTRLARYIFEEFFNLKGKQIRYLSTLATLTFPVIFTFVTLHDAMGNPVPAWQAVWPLFGATNQLLAALALLVVFVWLKKQGKKTVFIVLPMLFMLVMTIWALIQLVIQSGLNTIGITAIFLLVLATILIIEALRTIFITGDVLSPTTAE
ncbi:MAG: carbon starvation CstA family protein [Candidatus Cyclobacteriaceae bacterium M3_2C_046]